MYPGIPMNVEWLNRFNWYSQETLKITAKSWDKYSSKHLSKYPRPELTKPGEGRLNKNTKRECIERIKSWKEGVRNGVLREENLAEAWNVLSLYWVNNGERFNPITPAWKAAEIYMLYSRPDMREGIRLHAKCLNHDKWFGGYEIHGIKV